MTASWKGGGGGGSSSLRPWILSVTLLLGGVVLLAATFVTTNKHQQKSSSNKEQEIRVAFLGNSIFYFNDCPRLLQHMMGSSMVQNSCLRGGASFVSLLIKGNGMQEKFNSRPGQATNDIGAPTVKELLLANNNGTTKWDFVLMNDYTQAPARRDSREKSIKALKDEYAPMIRDCGATPIFLQTAAYRKEAIRDTKDLGNVQEFTAKVKQGYQMYAEALAKELPPEQQPRVAPVGDAFLYVHNHNMDLWNKLYWTDDFHPSPYGTWLQACVLYCTILNQAPPIYNPKWFETARYFPDEDLNNIPFPTLEEAHELRKVASVVCGIGGEAEKELEDPQ